MQRTDGTVAPWREGGEEDEPMHRWYDMRRNMFDVLSERQCRRLYAPRIVDGEVLSPDEWQDRMYGGGDVRSQEEEEELERACPGVDLLTAEQMMAAKMDVRLDDAAAGEGEVEDGVDRDDFQAWVVLKASDVASEVLKWWKGLDEMDARTESSGFAKFGAT